MRRRNVGLGLVLLGLIGGWCAGSRSANPQAAPSAAARPASFQLQGVASCSTSGCHHGNGERGQKGSEYTTWALHDPHARAFEVLLEQRSREIEARLRGLPDIQEARPEQSALCLHCHVQPGVDARPRSPRFNLADGVGCESCHGAAEKWLAPHRGWKSLSTDDRQAAFASHGMTWLRDPLTRARVCADCHVGTPAARVDHDLIAAGHPRLAFELGAYLAHLPRHWDGAAEKKALPDLEARSWAIGQVVTARRSLELLAEPAHAGPEFAAYDCISCHHDLRPKNRRDGLRSADTPPGSLVWGSWPFALLPPAVDFQPMADRAALTAVLAELRQEMEKPAPADDAVRAKARQGVELLDRWLQTADQGRYGDADFLRQTMTALRTDSGTGDDLLQRYLALTALQQALTDVDGKPPDPKLQEYLGELRNKIRPPATPEP
jgi:hypothetical protein